MESEHQKGVSECNWNTKKEYQNRIGTPKKEYQNGIGTPKRSIRMELEH